MYNITETNSIFLAYLSLFQVYAHLKPGLHLDRLSGQVMPFAQILLDHKSHSNSLKYFALGYLTNMFTLA